MANKKILLGLTTTPNSDWQAKIKEIDELSLKEVALFLTGLTTEKRKELYALLEKTGLQSIPHVHLRDDAGEEELEYLTNKYASQVFNIHCKDDPHPSFEPRNYSDKNRSRIYVENTDTIPDEDELNIFGGICVDFSHWQDGILFNKLNYDKKMKAMVEKFNVGCSHISAVGEKVIESNDIQSKEIKYENFSKHHFDKLEEFDYIKNFISYLPNLISLELVNSFEEQLKVKKYLEEIINNT